jgi:hypothetical protein
MRFLILLISCGCRKTGFSTSLRLLSQSRSQLQIRYDSYQITLKLTLSLSFKLHLVYALLFAVVRFEEKNILFSFDQSNAGNIEAR